MSPRRSRLLIGALLFAAAAALIAARRPDVFLRPQFWAEDGMEWYARAYNAPLTSATMAYGGYWQAFPRAVGLLSQLVDLRFAPLLMAVLALLVQSLVPVFLLSDRFAAEMPGRACRLVLALLLIAAANSMEVHVNVTNAHVHLALLAFLVLLAAPSRSRAWRAFDVTCLLVSGLSGPFCVLLLPIAFVVWLRRRESWTRTRLLCVLAAALVQSLVLVPRGSGHRGQATPSGASFTNLLDILGGQIFVAGVSGVWSYARLTAGAFADHPWLPTLIGALGLVLVARAAVVTRSFALRLFLLFAALHLAAALTTPVIFGPKPLWELLKTPWAGQRYYYFSTLAFLATLLWTVAADRSRVMRGVAATLLAVLLLVGIPRDWRHLPRRDLDFAGQVERFHAAPPGEKVELLITPDAWTMVLVKH